MENASKALLMAGGILIAIMVISVGMLVFSKVRETKTEDAKINLSEQVNSFNLEYTSYERNLLYGIDVISVCKKAINNNLELLDNGESDAWFVNIIVDIKNNTFETTVKRSNKKVKNSTLIDSSISAYESESSHKYDVTNYGTGVNGKISIGDYADKNDYKSWKPNDDIVKFFNQKVKTLQDSPSGSDYTYYIYPALVNFKSAVFECTSVKYNDDGRVCEMTFTIQ